VFHKKALFVSFITLPNGDHCMKFLPDVAEKIQNISTKYGP